MKKRLLLPLLFAGLWATPAMAAPYVSVSAGLGLLNNSDGTRAVGSRNDAIEYNTGVPIGVAVGYKVDEFRVEGAIGYQSHSIDRAWDGSAMVAVTDSDISIWSFMANGYYDISIKDSSVSPYLTAGLGFASIDGNHGGSSSTEFAWQLGAGVGIKASENVVVDLGYRYFKTADVSAEIDGIPTDLSISGSNILVGARYSF